MSEDSEDDLDPLRDMVSTWLRDQRNFVTIDRLGPQAPETSVGYVEATNVSPPDENGRVVSELTFHYPTGLKRTVLYVSWVLKKCSIRIS